MLNFKKPIHFLTALALFFCLPVASHAATKSPATSHKIVDIQVFPKDVSLFSSRDSQSIIVQAVRADGVTLDVTSKARFSILDSAIAKASGNVIRGVKDGATKIRIQYAGRKFDLPLKVSGATKDRPISFRLDVMPVLTKAGCNTGSCHGAARGKDGFHLSLFGYDPARDYNDITRQLSGRRINLALPHESLLIEKGIGAVNHTGGEKIKKGSPLYKTLVRWIEAGAPNDDVSKVAKVNRIEIYPKSMVLEGAGAKQQLTVRAVYSDGTNRDITSRASFITNNERSAAISETGAITAGVRGEAFVMARFDAFTVGSPVIVLPKNAKLDWPNIPENNYVDKLINAKLKKLRMTPSELCSDRIFIRRAYLDIIGKVPTPEAFQKFIADKDPKKRDKLVDELLGRKEFVEMWVMKFAELLQIRSDGNVNRGISYKATVLYYNWLQEQIANNVPMNKIVQQLLSSKGGTFSNPASNFYQIERDNLKVTENVAQVFMGMRIQCAQCHNHPFDRWTMDDYYGFMAFFTQIGRKRAEDPRETIVYNRGSGNSVHPVGRRVMAPKFLGGVAPDTKGKDRREVLAQWLASPKNPFFARNLSNIVWAHFFGRGIVEPVDDVRISNPPSNGPLLDALAQRFTSYNYDFKKLVRDICTSRTYQLSTRANPSNELDHRNFSRSAVRRIRAEVLYDVISSVTNTANNNKFRGLPRGARAVQIADGRTSTYFLTTFGRATRETVCSCEVKMEPNLSQALHLINGSVQAKIAQGGVVAKLLATKKSPKQIVDYLYMHLLSRKPSKKEMDRFNKFLAEDKNTRQVLEDIFWALVNSKEFIFNH